ncbi:hypothetical protein [Parvicella tangerina]|uniref:Uncharacterized protein n=1 Tax=Parvicella tangerina TaxID=2829795 RepID=A0A916JJR0_9FLAO|nr:hypothetical protein [Parvicella tangerina]CAG5078210.1 hypothetical protein CRYO30217_00607 [Parvicella tangerina]
MKELVIGLILITFGLVSCEFDFTKEEEDPTEDLLFSEVDGQEYQEALDQGGARALSSMILLGYAKQIQPEMVSIIADSIPHEDSLWRNRHYEAISMYNETYDDIPSSLHYKFGIAIFNMLMFHPNEVINHFDSATVLELDFWNDRLKEELHYKVAQDSIPIISMVAMSQDHCSSCDSTRLNTIKKMIETLYSDV